MGGRADRRARAAGPLGTTARRPWRRRGARARRPYIASPATETARSPHPPRRRRRPWRRSGPPVRAPYGRSQRIRPRWVPSGLSFCPQPGDGLGLHVGRRPGLRTRPGLGWGGWTGLQLASDGGVDVVERHLEVVVAAPYEHQLPWEFLAGLVGQLAWLDAEQGAVFPHLCAVGIAGDVDRSGCGWGGGGAGAGWGGGGGAVATSGSELSPIRSVVTPAPPAHSSTRAMVPSASPAAPRPAGLGGGGSGARAPRGAVGWSSGLGSVAARIRSMAGVGAML